MQSARQVALSRRNFLKNTGRVAAATTLAASMVPAVHAAENNTIQLALIGCGGRGGGAVGDAVSVNRGPVKLVAMADVFEDRLNGSLQLPQAGFRRSDRRAPGPPLRRLRRLPQGDGLSQAGRHRHLRHAAGLPLDPLRLRHREEAQRLHGEAAHRRRPDVPQDVQAGGRGDRQEPQGGRGIDVAAQPRDATTGRTDPRRRDRRDRAYARLSHARSRRFDALAAASPTARPNWSTRSAASTAFSGPAAAASATSTSTSSTIAAG